MQSLTVAAIQQSSGSDIDTNLERAARLLSQARDAGATLAVLPENFAAMYASQAQRARAAEADGSGQVQEFIAEQARSLGLWIVAGTLPIKGADPQRPYAACCLYDSTGARVCRYDKIHLFDVHVPGSDEQYSESDYCQAGEQTAVADTPWGRLGIAVCYDLRFPEQFRNMLHDGLDFLAVPAAFTVSTGHAHWEILLRARALENQCFLIAAAQTGQHPGGRKTYGHSMIVGPWGEVLAEAGQEEQLITQTLDLQRQLDLRVSFPVLRHRSL